MTKKKFWTHMNILCFIQIRPVPDYVMCVVKSHYIKLSHQVSFLLVDSFWVQLFF